MKTTDIVKVAKSKFAHLQKIQNSSRFLKVLGIFVHKGLLISDKIKPYKGKVTIQDVMWIGKNAEARVLEVLPAALASFPSYFIGKIPEDLKEIVHAIKSGRDISARWQIFEFKDLKKQAEIPSKDRRTVIASKRRVSKSFRLLEDTIRKIEDAAKARGVSQGEALDLLIGNNFN